MNQPEQWRALEWAPNYEFSNLGRVRRTTAAPGTYAGKIMSQSMANGYRQLNLSLPEKVASKKVHRLVCEAFHGPPPTVFHQTAHQDGDRTNNRADNLRWATPVENSADDLVNGVRPMGEAHPLAKITEADAELIRSEASALIARFAEQFGITRGQVRNIMSGKAWAVRRHAHPPASKAD